MAHSESSTGAGRLPQAAEEHCLLGNCSAFDRRWSDALGHYDRALHLAPGSAALRVHRADVLLARGWPGDAAQALQDCDEALERDPQYARAALKRVCALKALGQLQCALAQLQEYSTKFPDCQTNETRGLQAELEAAIKERQCTHDVRRQAALKRREERKKMRQLMQRRKEAAQRALREVQAAALRTNAGTPPPPPPPPPSLPQESLTPFTLSAVPPSSARSTPQEFAAAVAAVEQSPGLSNSNTASASGALGVVNAGNTEASETTTVGTATACPSDLGVTNHLGSSVIVAPTAALPSGPAPARHADNATGLVPALSAPESAAADAGADTATRPGSGTAVDLAAVPHVEGITGRSLGQQQQQQQEGGRRVGPIGNDREDAHEDDDGVDDGTEADESNGSARYDEFLDMSTDGSDDEEEPEEDPDLAESLLPYYVLGASAARLADGPLAPQLGGALQGWPAGGRPSLWRHSATGRRTLQRFVGQCNLQTDIKEAIFVGAGDSLVAAGSDDGRVFIYDADTGVPIRALDADEDVANCVQCHPTMAVLATSGIEKTVRLWSPGETAQTEALVEIIQRNQERVREGSRPLRASVLHTLAENPQLWQMLINNHVIGRRAGGNEGGSRATGRGGGGTAGSTGGVEGAEEGEDEDDDEGTAEVTCRMN